MAEGNDHTQDKTGDHKWLTEWEHSCLQDLENETNMEEERLQNDLETSHQHLWVSFQNSATAIAQLFRERAQDGVSLWVPFQNSASCVTILYKDSLECMKRIKETSFQIGQQRKTRELINFLKKRRRHVRRDELIGYLCGKTVPLKSRPSASLSRANSRVPDWTCALSRVGNGGSEAAQPDLEPFRDALALQRLNGAMSNISMGYQNGAVSPQRNSPTAESDEAFHCFVVDEMTRRCEGARKRNANNSDVTESPSRKRSRLL